MANDTAPAIISIDQAIAKVDMWNGRTVRPERIHSGITNINWRIILPDRDETFFLKIHGPGTESFIDRAVAHEAAVKVSTTGYAPQLLFYDPVDGIEVYEFLHGFRSCGVRDTQNPVIRQNVLAAYKAVHTTQSLAVAKTGFAQLDNHLVRLRQMNAEFPADFEFLLWQCARVERAVTASGIDLCACYNDGYISNYMVNDALEAKIIDWEYAANNDPYWDVAMFCFESFFLTAADHHDILEMYDGASRAEIAARIHLYIGAAAVTWGLWATYQKMKSSIPFDFGKYADILFMRARQMMTVAAWETSLKAV